MSEIVKFDDNVGTLLNHYVESGMFPDVRSMSQAVVKADAGRAYGMSPIESMGFFEIVQGKVGMKPIGMGALVKSSKKYDYAFTECTKQSATVVIKNLESGLESSFTFTMEDAKDMGLASKDNWRKQPKTMLMWRALSHAVRFFCPDILRGGVIYTTEELSTFEEVPKEPTASSMLQEWYASNPEHVDEVRGKLRDMYPDVKTADDFTMEMFNEVLTTVLCKYAIKEVEVEYV